jgi:hypothetical protein
MALKTYNGKEVVLIINGLRVSGFDENDMFTVARNNPSFEGVTGADGEHTRHHTNDKSGTVTINLGYQSAANAALSALLGIDENTGAGVFSMLIQDLNGASSATGEQCYITGYPEWGVSKETPVLEWVITVADLKMLLGGL